MKKLIFIIIVIVAALGITFTNLNKDVPDNSQPDEIVDPVVQNESSKSVIQIIHIMSNGEQTVTKSASAVVISEDDTHYYAVTNYHVLIKDDYETTEIEVYDYLQNKYIASRISLNQAQEIISTSYDLGLIKFEKSHVKLPIPEFRENSMSSLTVLSAVGYPNGSRTVTSGSYLSYVNVNGYVITLIEHNAELQPGNSGGGLFDASGKLVGINIAGVFDNEGTLITSYAIPVHKVSEYLSLFNL